MSSQKRHIFLIGPSGVGKTTVARKVSELLDRPLIDLDEHISALIGMPISQYFTDNGEAAFRTVERQAIIDLTQQEQDSIFATGGGSVLDTRNVIDMRNSGYVIYLSAFEADLIERIKGDEMNDRPLLKDDLEGNIHQQFISRRECYELASEITIATSRRDVDTVAEAVVRQYKRSSGLTADGASPIIVGANLLGTITEVIPEYPVIVLVSQENIPHTYREVVKESIEKNGVRVVECLIDNGENAKSFDSYQRVIERMSSERVPRSGCVVALGGGVVGDLSGFVAASYHRGIDVIHIPTTLLAQVDSSIGGKCGINLTTGKNLVGAFHQPKCIIADTLTLESLPQTDFLSGLGEVVKYALLGNTSVAQIIRDSSAKILARDPEALVPLIRACMNHKVQIVARDPYERNGIRATLNLGHTLAHAIETSTHYSIAHGEAVAIGLRYIAYLSHALGLIPESQRDESIELVELLGLKADVPVECGTASGLVDLMYTDKKSQGGLSLVLMNVEGSAELVHDIDRSFVESTLNNFMSH